MTPVLSYCTARMFSIGLLPMVAMRPRHMAAENDNDRPPPFPGTLGSGAGRH
jgi:hypothetical protein